jgi:hypothetical protein
MSADDIRAGFAGADDFAKQDTFKLPDYVVPHDWNVAEIAWELYELDAEQLGFIIALDPDALPKTLQMAKELRGHVNDVRVLKLTDDLKYRNPTDMENLHGIINN